MRRRGLSLDEHRARTVTRGLLEGADLAVCMGQSHLSALRARFPGLTTPIRAFDDPPVSDPYGGDAAAYERAARDIARQLPALLDALSPAVYLVPPTEADEGEVLAYRDEFLSAGEPLHGTARLAGERQLPRMAGRRARQSNGRDGAPRPGALHHAAGAGRENGRAGGHDRHPPPPQRLSAGLRRAHRLQRAPLPAAQGDMPRACWPPRWRCAGSWASPA